MSQFMNRETPAVAQDAVANHWRVIVSNGPLKVAEVFPAAMKPGTRIEITTDRDDSATTIVRL
jgi:hypothetical protein